MQNRKKCDLMHNVVSRTILIQDSTIELIEVSCSMTKPSSIYVADDHVQNEKSIH